MDSAPQASADRAWFIAQRWQQYDGELRANMLRIAAIGLFYLLHLWNYLGSQGKLPNWGLLQLGEAGAVDQRFHVLATLLALSWALVAAAIQLCLRNQIFPRWISAASTVFDLLMLTSVLCISNGPRSPVVVGYFLIIALAGIRFSLPLVRLATIGAALGYLCVLGVARWPARFGRAADLEIGVPRYQQIVTLAAILLCGVCVGQIVRRAEHGRGVRTAGGRVASRKGELVSDQHGDRCSQCDATFAPGATTCWLCGAALPGAASSARIAEPRPLSAAAPPRSPPVARVAENGSRHAGFSYSISTLLLGMTLAAICAALLAAAPGLGIVLCFLLAPVLLRTAMVVRRRAAAGVTVTPAQKVGLAITSLLVAQVILAVVLVASVGTFCAVCLGGYALTDGRGDESTLMLLAGVAALAVTLPTCAWLIRWIRKRYRRDVEPLGDA